MRIVIYTFFALTAFAANSVLCRMALGEKTIDPSSFTIIRLFSGTIILLFIMKIKYRVKTKITKMRWLSSGMLFIYAVSFSFAYMTLSTGTGALVLFGSVQTFNCIFRFYIFGSTEHFDTLICRIYSYVHSWICMGRIFMAGNRFKKSNYRDGS